jgi:guanine deaminase
MRQAGVVGKTGGPFDAVVVRDGKVLAESGNSVIRDNDPSAHAEVNAIRMACHAAGSPNICSFIFELRTMPDVLRYGILGAD